MLANATSKLSAGLLAFAILTADAALPPSSSCDDNGDLACTAAPRGDSSRAGTAMLQVGSHSTKGHKVDTNQTNAKDAEKAREKAKSAPLKLRVETLEKEVAALQERVSALQADVGVSGGASAAAAPEEAPAALLGGRRAPPRGAAARDDDDDDGDEALVEISNAKGSRDDTIKGKVAALEATMAQVKSHISQLENQVMGEVALLQAGRGSGKEGHVSASDKGSGSSLKSRIESLESELDSCRTRASTLEHEVTG